MRDDNLPRTLLERSSEAERLRRFSQRLTKACREGVRVNEVASHIFVDSFDDDIDESKSCAAGCGRSVRRTQWCDREERSAGQLGCKRGSFPRVLVRCADVDESCIYQHPPKDRLELLGRAGGDDLPPAAGKRGADQCAGALALQVD